MFSTASRGSSGRVELFNRKQNASSCPFLEVVLHRAVALEGLTLRCAYDLGDGQVPDVREHLRFSSVERADAAAGVTRRGLVPPTAFPTADQGCTP